MANQIILAGYLSQEITNSTLGEAYPGSKQRVSFSIKLSEKIVGMLLSSDIYALLGSYTNTNKEMVKLLKGSFNQTTNSVDIIRGISKFASNEYANSCVVFSRPSRLSLDFGVINPYILQSINSNSSIDNPKIATNLDAGILKTAYRPDFLKVDQSQLAITNDNPAFIGLAKALFGLNTATAETGNLNQTDNLRISIVSQLIDYLAQDTSRLDKLKKLIG